MLQENKNCYASQAQREIIIALINHDLLKDNFFLTSGTALSVFYLHHRKSNDLDFFALKQSDLSEIDFSLKTNWKSAYTKIKESSHFLSVLIQNVKVEFVIVRLSFEETRERYYFNTQKFLLIDSIRNIFSNKFCTIVSRTEPKDFIDFYFLNSTLRIDSLTSVYEDARKKDAIFDDPPTVAYQIEQGIQFLQRNPDIFPQLLTQFDFEDFNNFYQHLVNWIYRKMDNI
jgi:predicted nucleotidyltransferase component of viral defense system